MNDSPQPYGKQGGRGCYCIGIIIVLLCLLVVALIWLRSARKPHPSLILLSPNEQYCALLIEKTGFFEIDRNFAVIVEKLEAGEWYEVQRFDSPDEGLPRGTERFIWSDDSQYVLLAGRHFVMRESVPTHLVEGEQAYLLIAPMQIKIWCNASQVSEKSFPRFSIDDLRDRGFRDFQTDTYDDAQGKVLADFEDVPSLVAYLEQRPSPVNAHLVPQ